jgi:hypothetical protein
MACRRKKPKQREAWRQHHGLQGRYRQWLFRRKTTQDQYPSTKEDQTTRRKENETDDINHRTRIEGRNTYIDNNKMSRDHYSEEQKSILSDLPLLFVGDRDGRLQKEKKKNQSETNRIDNIGNYLDVS